MWLENKINPKPEKKGTQSVAVHPRLPVIVPGDLTKRPPRVVRLRPLSWLLQNVHFGGRNHEYVLFYVPVIRH